MLHGNVLVTDTNSPFRFEYIFDDFLHTFLSKNYTNILQINCADMLKHVHFPMVNGVIKITSTKH
jgi:hypothetical protein